MNYFILIKTDKPYKLRQRIFLYHGFPFNKKVKITLYHPETTRFILIKKLNTSLRGLINLYKVYDDDDDDDTRREALLPRIELLRRILIEQYADFLEETEIESYLDKLNKFEYKVDGSKSKKSRSR